jgi:hypothetical protein
VLITELRMPPTLVERRIRARVRLSCAGFQGSWVDVPPLTLPFPSVPVPTIFAGFSVEDQKHRALVVVPKVLKVDNVEEVINQIEAVQKLAENLVGQVTAFADFVTAVAKVPRMLRGAASVVVRRADEINNLNDIHLAETPTDNPEAEDEFESLVLIGAPGRQIRLYNDRDLKNNEGQLRVTTNDVMYADVDNLGGGPPPDTDPEGRAKVEHEPESGDNFENTISSLRFVWD